MNLEIGASITKIQKLVTIYMHVEKYFLYVKWHKVMIFKKKLNYPNSKNNVGMDAQYGSLGFMVVVA